MRPRYRDIGNCDRLLRSKRKIFLSEFARRKVDALSEFVSVSLIGRSEELGRSFARNPALVDPLGSTAERIPDRVPRSR